MVYSALRRLMRDEGGQPRGQAEPMAIQGEAADGQSQDKEEPEPELYPVARFAHARGEPVGVVHIPSGVRRHLADAGQGLAHDKIDGRALVDGPAGSVQQGPEAPAPELEPGDDHRGPGNADEHPHQGQRPPPAEGGQRVGDIGEGRAEYAEGHADGGEDAGALGEVKGRLGLRRFCRRRGHSLGAGLADALLLGGEQLVHLLADKVGDADIGRPHRLAQADGIVHHLGDDRIPFLAVIVDEQAVAPVDERGEVAGRERGRDGTRGHGAVLLGAADVAIDQEFL